MRFRHRYFASVVLAATISGLVLPARTAAKPPSNKYKGAEIITAAQLKDYLTFIASDELEGRDTPSRGLDIAAKFIATHLSRWGFKPAGGEGSYFQRFALLKTTVDSVQSVIEINGQRFKHGVDRKSVV